MHGEIHQLIHQGIVVIAISLAIGMLFAYLRFALVAGLVIAGASAKLLMYCGLVALNLLAPHAPGSSELTLSVILLCHGLDSSIERLFQSSALIFVGGGVQIILTISLGALCAPLIITDCTVAKAIYTGMLMATSSTALVFYELRARKTEHTAEGYFASQVLIAHDLVLLPFALVLPLLAPAVLHDGHAVSFISVFETIAFGVVIMIGVFGAQWLFVAPSLDWIGQRVSRELLNMAVALVILITASVCVGAQLSPAFGMFVAGVLISRSKLRNLIRGTAGVIRNVALPIFFISIGSLFAWEAFCQHWLLIIVASAGMMLIKFISAAAGALSCGYTMRPAMRAGGYLAHIGEASFALGLVGREKHLFTDADAEKLIAIAVISIACSPWVDSLVARIAETWPDFGLRHFRDKDKLWLHKPTDLKNHTVIVGFGRVGLLLANRLRELGEPFFIVDKSADRADLAYKMGFGQTCGDAAEPHTLKICNAGQAKLIVLTDASIGLASAVSSFDRAEADGVPAALIIRVETEEIAEELRHLFPSAIVVSAEAAVQLPLMRQVEMIVKAGTAPPKPAAEQGESPAGEQTAAQEAAANTTREQASPVSPSTVATPPSTEG